MQLILNQQPCDLEIEPPTVSALIAKRGITAPALAVAVNGEIVHRADWELVQLHGGDRIDIVRAVAGGAEVSDEPLTIAGRSFQSRLFLGTGKYSSPEAMLAALEASGTEMVTVAIRYMGLDGNGAGQDILGQLDLKRYQLLPNTAGATTADQAVHMARLAREATGTNWIKLEVIGDSATLWPDVAGTVDAAKVLVDEGFVVLAYTSPDIVAACRLEQAGVAAVMPLASLIGSGRGFQDLASVRMIAERITAPVVVDAGLGTASDAALAMELGADACLINTAVARAEQPQQMAAAMRLAIEAGRRAYLAGRMAPQVIAAPSSPVAGVPVSVE